MAEEQKTSREPRKQADKHPEAPQATEQAAAEVEQPAIPEKAPEAPSRPAPQLPEGKDYIWGTGRRKTAVARVRIKPGSGKITVNKRDMEAYFKQEQDRQSILSPLRMANMAKSWDIWANVVGGGPTGQAGAVTLGLARAIAKAVPDLDAVLRDNGLLTRDARMTERKKYGQKGARKRFQFSKR